MSKAENSSPQSARRHDLDALRAVAMLLGIFLHGILSFTPREFPWFVKDQSLHELWLMPFSVIHGFRMPLFFLVSGYFTMMLFRKRGVWSLLSHRVKRIFLPLLLGLVTIVPVCHWVSSQAITVSSDVFWFGVFTGDVTILSAHLESGDIDVEQYHPEFGATPLGIASLYGHLGTMEALIESGADVNHANRDRNAPIHTVAFTGNYRAYLILKEAGVDVDQTNADGSTARSNCQLDWNVTKAIADALRLPLKKEQVLAGRKLIVADLDGNAIDASSLSAAGMDGVTSSGKESVPQWLKRQLLDGRLFLHLWFLWSLFLLVIVFLVLGGIGKLVRFDPGWFPKWLLMPPISLLWLIPLAAWSESYMSPIFGPDTATGLVPNFNLLAYYGIFFFYGAIYFHCRDEQGRLGWWWFLTVPLSLFLVFPFTVSVLHDPQWKEYRILAAVLESVYVWLMVFGSIGFFRLLLSRESKIMRYVSDSSYWLYLAHLPLVIWLQLLVRDWNLSSPVKALLVIGVATVSLLISYQIFVRYTPIGWLLNGKRGKA